MGVATVPGCSALLLSPPSHYEPQELPVGIRCAFGSWCCCLSLRGLLLVFVCAVRQFSCSGAGSVELGQYEDMPAICGLQFEPILLGAYGGDLAVMMFVMYLRERQRRYLFGYAFCGLASMAVSLSRAAVLATALILVAIALWA